jgi:uncharacterized protein YjiK
MAFKIRQLAISLSTLMLITACGGGSDKKEGGTNPDPGTGTIKGKTIAAIDEASGICYSADNDALFVVSDKGVIYKLDMQGKILEQHTHKSAAGKKYDYEGVACDDANGNVIVAVEGKDNLHTIEQSDLSALLKNNQGKPTGDIVRPDNDTLFKDDKGKTGIEGITINDGSVYVSNQSLVAYPGKDSSFVFTVDDSFADAPNIDRVIDHKQLDIVGLSFHKGIMYMLSATNHKLIAYNVDEEKVVSTKDLPAGIDAEGVAFDNAGNIYFADDKNGKVYQYKASDFGVN